MTPPLDAVIVGGGIMGCASALSLAEAGARVVVLERSVPGAEASSAAAGILGAQTEAHAPGPVADLSLASRSRWRAFAAHLAELTGIDVEYRPCGVMRLGADAAAVATLQAEASWHAQAGLRVEKLDPAGARAKEPALSEGVLGGVRFPDDARVDPPSLLRALHIAASRAGAGFRTGTYVRRIDVESGRAAGVTLEDGSRIAASKVVVAAGSWSTLVGGVPLDAAAVRPARGQIVELDLREPCLGGVVFGPGCYLVPRDDGRVLVGSTLEFVGYKREVTAKAVRDLLDAALRLVPALAEATLGRTWSNFRPYTESGHPLLGPTATEGLILATGHFRNGILLAPITAEIVRAVARGEPPPLDLAPFAPPS